MNNTPHLVDISSLVGELDQLNDLSGSDSEHFDALLDLVERLRVVSAQARAASPSDEGWAAVAFGGGDDLDLYCSRLNAANRVVRATWVEGDLIAPGLPAEVEALTSGMLDDLKGRVNEETRALIEAAMLAPPGASPNGKNGLN